VTWKRAYVVVWTLDPRDQYRTIPYPTRRWAERRLRREKKLHPERVLHVERLPLF
jgi:hypothetical protein